MKKVITFVGKLLTYVVLLFVIELLHEFYVQCIYVAFTEVMAISTLRAETRALSYRSVKSLHPSNVT